MTLRKTVLAALALGLTASTGVQACAPEYRVRGGDSLYSIAEAQLGSAADWSRIYTRNADKIRGVKPPRPGTVLRIPCPPENIGPATIAATIADAQPQLADPAGAPTGSGLRSARNDAAPVRVRDHVRIALNPPPQDDSAGFEFVARSDFAPPSLPATRRGRPMMQVLTGSGYAPFTDKGWPAEGMLTELVRAALTEGPVGAHFDITWENDWSKHLYPMIDDKHVDMGFPWFRPDCAAMPNHDLCRNFHFSEPLVDLVILLYTSDANPVTFRSDADIIGRSICRPAGYYTHDLDRPGREWLTKDAIRLIQPDTPEACFELLAAGGVDFVALNEFSGEQAIHALGLSDQIMALPRPLSRQGLYMVVSKTHGQGTTNIHRFNQGLRALKASRGYDEILSRHLAHFRDSLQGD